MGTDRQFLSPSTNKTRSSRRAGFTLIEVVSGLVIMTLVMAFSLPTISRAIRSRQANRSVQVLGTDFLLAQSLAARQRSPIRIALDASSHEYAFIQLTTGDTLHRRSFGSAADLRVEQLTFSPSVVDVMPSGVSTSPLTIQVVAGQSNHSVTVSRAGQIRVN